MRSLSRAGGPLSAAALVLMWSSGFVGARLATDTADTLTVLMWRFLIVVGLLVPWWLFLRRSRRPLRLGDIAVQVAVGLLAQSIYLLSSVKAIELGVPTGTTALIESLQPLFAGALVGPLLNERVSGRQWAGLGLGLLAVAMVIGDGLKLATGQPVWIYGVPFVGMFTLTAATLLQRRRGTAVALTDSLAIQCCTSAVFFTALGLITGHARPPDDSTFWVAVLWMVLLATFGGYGFYWLNLKHHTVTRVNSLIYLSPPTTAFWAFAMFGDPVGVLAMVGFVVSLAAVLLVNWSGRSDASGSGHSRRHGPPSGDTRSEPVPAHRSDSSLPGPSSAE